MLYSAKRKVEMDKPIPKYRFKKKRHTSRFKVYNKTIKKKASKIKRIERRKKLISKVRKARGSIFSVYNKLRFKRGESFLFFYRKFIRQKGTTNSRKREDVIKILTKHLDIFSLSTLLLIYKSESFKIGDDLQINSFMEVIKLKLLPFFNLQLYNTENFKRILNDFPKKIQGIFLFVLKYIKKILKIQNIIVFYEKGYIGENDFVLALKKIIRIKRKKREQGINLKNSIQLSKKTKVKKIKEKLKRKALPELLKLKKEKKTKKVVRIKKKKTEKEKKLIKRKTYINKIIGFYKVLRNATSEIIKKIQKAMNIYIYCLSKLKKLTVASKRGKKKKTINNILKAKHIEFILGKLNKKSKATFVTMTDRLSFIETAIKIFKVISRYSIEERQGQTRKNLLLVGYDGEEEEPMINTFLLPWGEFKKKRRRTYLRKTFLTARQRFSQKAGISMYKLWRLTRKTRKNHRGGLYIDFLGYFELRISKILKQSNFINKEHEIVCRIKMGDVCINGKMIEEIKKRIKGYDIISFRPELRKIERAKYLLKLKKGEIEHSLYGFIEYNFLLHCFMFLPLYFKYQQKLTSTYLKHLNKGRFFIEKR